MVALGWDGLGWRLYIIHLGCWRKCIAEGESLSVRAVALLCGCWLQSALHLVSTGTLCSGDREIGGHVCVCENERGTERGSVSVMNFETCVSLLL